MLAQLWRTRPLARWSLRRRRGAPATRSSSAPCMALAAQLAAWAQRAPGWSVQGESRCSGHLGGAHFTLHAKPLDDDTAELSLSGDGENCLRLSVSLRAPPFLFALDDGLSRLAESANEALERGASGGAAGCGEQSPLGAALSALAAAAARAPSLVAALRAHAHSDAPDCDDVDSDSDAGSTGTADYWYGGVDLAVSSIKVSGAELRGLQASFLFGHAAQAAAACASAPRLSPEALAHLRVQPQPESCAVHGWLETIELPTPGIADALGLHPHAPLRLTFLYSPPTALRCASAAAAFDGAELSWSQPDAPKPAVAPDGGVIVQRFGVDVFLPALAKELAAKWRAEVEASPAKRTRRAAHAGGVNAFLWFLQETWHALAEAASHCAVCRAPLPAPGARLAPCSRDVCVFNFEEMGGCPLLPLLREAGGASAALHCALAHAAAAGGSCEAGGRDTFEPFPSFLLERNQQRQRAGFFDAHAAGAAAVDLAQLAENKKLGCAVIVGVLCTLPPLAELAAMPDEAALRRRLLHHDWRDVASAQTSVPSARMKAAAELWSDADVPDMAWRVLQFVLSTPRVQLQLLAGTDKLAGLPAEAVQLAIVGNSDAREAAFQARRQAAGGSFFAFHGSATSNWYSITRNGLRSLSQTAMMANGAAYGAGVYLATNLQMSMGYTQRGGYPAPGAWHRAAADFAAAFVDLDVAKTQPVIVALCEVTNTAPQGNRAGAGMHVVGTEDVALRYLLLLPQAAHSCDASSLRWNGAAVGEHIAALRLAALEAAETERAQLREPRRAALQAEAAQAGSEAVVNAAMARLEHAVAAQATSAAASATAAKAVVREYRELDRMASSLGLGLSLTGEDDVFRWRILMQGWESVSPELHEDLCAFAAATGLPPAVELEFTFSPEHFPYAPPFVRVVRPMFAFRTGHVTIGGSICMELLTSKGWSCAVSLESVLVTIRADMVEGGARLDRARFNSCYSEATAREAFKRVAQQHGWER